MLTCIHWNPANKLNRWLRKTTIFTKLCTSQVWMEGISEPSTLALKKRCLGDKPFFLRPSANLQGRLLLVSGRVNKASTNKNLWIRGTCLVVVCVFFGCLVQPCHEKKRCNWNQAVVVRNVNKKQTKQNLPLLLLDWLWGTHQTQAFKQFDSILVWMYTTWDASAQFFMGLGFSLLFGTKKSTTPLYREWFRFPEANFLTNSIRLHSWGGNFFGDNFFFRSGFTSHEKLDQDYKVGP